MRAQNPDAATKDEEQYKMVLLNTSLFVKIAQMALPLYRELNEKHQHEAIRYYYRKLDIQLQTVNTNSRQWTSANLFNEGVHPIKVFFALVLTDALKGELAYKNARLKAALQLYSKPSPLQNHERFLSACL